MRCSKKSESGIQGIHAPRSIDQELDHPIAFKYAFPNGGSGEVRVSLHQRERCIRLAVEDTGVGLLARPGAGEGKSLGLTIVKSLAKQLGGSMEITSGPGARFVLKFA
jgi:two-component sensor histidine kinase